VLPVAIPGRALPARHDDERARAANNAHHVAHDRLPIPQVERLVEPLRIAVIGGCREVEVVEPVVLACEQQFLGAQQSEGVEQLGADGVVARLASRDRQEDRPSADAAARGRQQRPLLVVRVGYGVQEARGGRELLEAVPRLDGAARGRWRRLLGRDHHSSAEHEEGRRAPRAPA
jgi:hypothetical protein